MKFFSILEGMYKHSKHLEFRLYNEKTFYPALIKDIKSSREEIIIESPYITRRRSYMLLPYIKKARKRGIKVILNTRDIEEYDDYMYFEASCSDPVKLDTLSLRREAADNVN